MQRRLLVGVFVVGLSVIWGIYYPQIAQGYYLPVILASLIALGVWSSMILLAHAIIDVKIKKARAAGHGLFAPTETIISEENCEVHRESNVAIYKWSTFSKYRYCDRVAVLFFAGVPFVFAIMPRSRFQTQHDWDCFLGLLDRKFPRG